MSSPRSRPPSTRSASPPPPAEPGPHPARLLRMTTPGQKLRDAVASSSPLQVLGVINAYSALQAEHAGARALYLSGAGVANASYGLPDLGLTGLEDVCIDIRRITD